MNKSSGKQGDQGGTQGGSRGRGRGRDNEEKTTLVTRCYEGPRLKMKVHLGSK